MISRAVLALMTLGLMIPPGVAFPRTIRLDPAPSFALSACIAPDGKLLIPDIQQGLLFVVDLARGSVDRVAHPGQGVREFNRPATVTCGEDGVVVDDNGWHLVWLDSRLTPRDGVFMPGQAVSDPGTPVREGLDYVAIHQILVREGAVFVDGTFRLQGELYKGVARISRHPLGVELLYDDYHDDPTRWTHFSAYQSLILRTLASAGDLYYLYFDGAPVLFDVTARKPVELPEPLRGKLPSLLNLDSRPLTERLGLLFSRVRQFPLPAGIWGWKGSLYLLSWRPGKEGVVWELWRREADGWRGPWTLPVRAPDLVVAPGPEAWAFVLKGVRTRPGEQEVSAVETIPAETIEEALR